MEDRAMNQKGPLPPGEKGSRILEKPKPRPFTELGERLDKELEQQEKRDWFIFSMVLALLLYLVMWFIDDAWRFMTHEETADATILPTLPTLSTTPLLTASSSPQATKGSPLAFSTPTPFTTSGISSLSPPDLFCSGMACGTSIVLVVILFYKWLSRKSERLPD